MILMFKTKKIILLLSSIAFLLISFHLLINDNRLRQSSLRPAGDESREITPKNRVERVQEFYSQVLNALQKFKPVAAGDLAQYRKDTCRLEDITHWTKEKEVYQSYKELDLCFQVGKDKLKGLSSSHAGYLKYIKSVLNVKPESKLFNALFPMERGVITVGGGKYSILALTMIKALRERGSSLPVEVFIPLADTPEDSFCEYITRWNAKCIYQTDFFPDKSASLSSYQTKALALLANSFKHAIFIDADNIPMMKLDDHFESEAYKEEGLILWPDVWVRVTAPVFYEIAGLKIDFSKRTRYLSDDVTPSSRYTDPKKNGNIQFNKEQLPMHDFDNAIPNISSETGQLFVDKSKHFLTLLLALYYNYFGKEWFYRMMSLGTSGEGDKETFISAAHVLQAPYYQVKTPISFDGYWDKDKSFKGVGLLQHDFSADYKLWKKAQEAAITDKPKGEYKFDENFLKQYFNFNTREEVPIMFTHASFHKFVPIDLYEEEIYIGEDGKQFRSFRNDRVLRVFDLELFAFENLEKHICIDKDIEFAYMKKKLGDDHKKFDGMCKYMKDRVTMLKNTHDDDMKKVT